MGGRVIEMPNGNRGPFRLIVPMSGPADEILVPMVWDNPERWCCPDAFELDYCMAYFLTMARIEGLSVRDLLSPFRTKARTDTLASILDR